MYPPGYLFLLVFLALCRNLAESLPAPVEWCGIPTAPSNDIFQNVERLGIRSWLMQWILHIFHLPFKKLFVLTHSWRLLGQSTAGRNAKLPVAGIRAGVRALSAETHLSDEREWWTTAFPPNSSIFRSVDPLHWGSNLFWLQLAHPGAANGVTALLLLACPLHRGDKLRRVWVMLVEHEDAEGLVLLLAACREFMRVVVVVLRSASVSCLCMSVSPQCATHSPEQKPTNKPIPQTPIIFVFWLLCAHLFLAGSAAEHKCKKKRLSLKTARYFWEEYPGIRDEWENSLYPL